MKKKKNNNNNKKKNSFADVEMGASAAGHTVHKIFRSAGELIADGEGAFPGSAALMGSHGLHSIDRTFRRMWLDPRRAIF